MKLCRFDEDRLGVVEHDTVYDVTDALTVLPPMTWPVLPGDALIGHLDEIVARVLDLVSSAPPRPLAELRLRSPVANPTKIIAAPVNYQKHLDEARADAGIHHGKDVKTIDYYGLFLKANSALAGPGDGIAIRFIDRRNDHEAEMVAVIGKAGSNIPRDRALEHVAGYAMGLDMTVRGTEDRSLRKSVDSYAVVGPWLVTAEEIADPGNLGFELRVNGELRQASNTRYLIFDVARLIEYASSFYTLYPGDMIMTGTPEGVGPVQPGDVIDFTMDRIGAMRVAVRAA